MSYYRYDDSEDEDELSDKSEADSDLDKLV